MTVGEFTDIKFRGHVTNYSWPEQGHILLAGSRDQGHRVF